MLKKLLFASLLISALGCLPLLAQSKERIPNLPKNAASFENKYPMISSKMRRSKPGCGSCWGKAATVL